MKKRDWLLLAGAVLVYAALVWPLRGWIIDDAGITFSYARTFASGYGLTSQPGVPPVEGYSNFLWLMIMTPFFLMGLFDPIVTPKLIGIALGAVTFGISIRIILYLTDGCRVTTAAGLLLLVFNTGFVVWTCSGLENPLMASLVTYLLWICLTWRRAENRLLYSSFLAGIIVVLLALTRPDGLVYIALPLLAILLPFWERNETLVKTIKRASLLTATFIGTVLLPLGAFFIFRRSYYGSWWPNTYYAKSGPRPADIRRALAFEEPYLDRLRELWDGILGFGTGMWLLLILIVTLVVVLDRKVKARPLIVSTFALAIAAGVYVLMPADWMGEFRFATPFFPLLAFVTLSAITLAIRALWTKQSTQRYIQISVFVFLALLTFREHIPRLDRFYKNPVVSFQNIADRFGHKFNSYADSLGVREGSVLLPDLGGTLYYSNLRVHDLTGLCDRTIARTLRRDRAAFHNYVFDSLKPTFIHMHGNWTYAARFDSDPRFDRDYISLYSYSDKWVRQATGLELISGDFVRREIARE